MMDEAVQIKFRVPASMRAALETAAATNGRSLSAEIAARLESTIAAPDALTHQEMSDAIMEYDKRIEVLEAMVMQLRERTGEDVYNSWKD